jgi:uncharacterized protein
MTKHRDDSEMSRFDRQGLRRSSARDAVLAVLVTMGLLVLFAGSSVLKAGEEKKPGIGRDILTAVGKPTNWAADSLPLEHAGSELTSTLSPNEQLDENASFDRALGGRQAGGIPLVTPEAFDPVQLGAPPATKRPLQTMLVTGDSLAQPLDLELARRLTAAGVDVIRDPHPGTGISNPVLVDWGQLSAAQVRDHHPQAVVVFIGANEGYPLPGPGGGDLACCGTGWAAAFANRVRQMMNTYRRGGAARVYWLTIPTPRDPDRQRVEKTVNAAIEVAAQPWASQVRVIDTVPVFTPGEEYRDAMDVDGDEKIVRESDGIHLNDTGSSVAAEVVLDRVGDDFAF